MKGFLVLLVAFVSQKVASKPGVVEEKKDDEQVGLLSSQTGAEAEMDESLSPDHIDVDIPMDDSDKETLGLEIPSRQKRSIFDDVWIYDTLLSRSDLNPNPYRSAFFDLARPAFAAADHRPYSLSKRSYNIPAEYRIFPANNKYRGKVNCKMWAWKTPRACRFS